MHPWYTLYGVSCNKIMSLWFSRFIFLNKNKKFRIGHLLYLEANNRAHDNREVRFIKRKTVTKWLVTTDCKLWEQESYPYFGIRGSVVWWFPHLLGNLSRLKTIVNLEYVLTKDKFLWVPTIVLLILRSLGLVFHWLVSTL